MNACPSLREIRDAVKQKAQQQIDEWKGELVTTIKDLVDSASPKTKIEEWKHKLVDTVKDKMEEWKTNLVTDVKDKLKSKLSSLRQKAGRDVVVAFFLVIFIATILVITIVAWISLVKTCMIHGIRGPGRYSEFLFVTLLTLFAILPWGLGYYALSGPT